MPISWYLIPFILKGAGFHGLDRIGTRQAQNILRESKNNAQKMMGEKLMGACHKDTGANLKKQLPLAKSWQAKHPNIKHSNKLQTTEKIWILETTMILLNT